MGSSPAPDVLAASYLLAVLAILLAWPVPVLLSRAAWPSRAPASAMVLWQGIALAGGLSMIGAFLCWGLSPLDAGVIPAALRVLDAAWLGTTPPHLTLVHVFALSLAALLTGHLLLTLVRSAWKLYRARQHHRALLAVLASPRPESVDARRAVVIENSAPLAYCLPGAGSTTVLTSGLLHSLDRAELRAVLAHEEAHLAQRHDLLLLAFTSWHAALPWLPTTRLALGAVRVLVEELADDAALRSCERDDLVGALAVVAAGPEPTGTVLPASGRPGTDTAGMAPSPAEPGGTRSPDPAASGTALPGPAQDAQPTAPAAAGSQGAAGRETAHLVTLGETLSSARLRRLLTPPAPLGWAASRTAAAAGVALVLVPTAALAVTGWSA